MTDERLLLLYGKYGRAVFARCCKMLGEPSSAEDATQEIFLRVGAHLDSAPTAVDALIWISRIATNYCLNELRGRKRRPEISPEAEVGITDPLSEESMVNRDLVRRIIDRVPEHLRAPALLHHVDGMSHDEIGRMLGISRRTVINYIGEFHERTLKFLRRDATAPDSSARWSSARRRSP